MEARWQPSGDVRMHRGRAGGARESREVREEATSPCLPRMAARWKLGGSQVAMCACIGGRGGAQVLQGACRGNEPMPAQDGGQMMSVGGASLARCVKKKRAHACPRWRPDGS